MLSPQVRFTAVIRAVLPLLDEGNTEGIGRIRERIEAGTILDHLSAKYDADLTSLDADDRADVIETFQRLMDSTPSSQFGIDHNGLALLIALATEAVQLPAGDRS